MSFPAYPKYKDSGVEWLRQVPEHWGVRRLKTIVAEPLKYGANESAELDDRTMPRFVRITDIDDDGGLRDETFKSLPAEIAEPFLLKEGDILLARSGATVGKSFIYSEQWGKACFAGYLIRARLLPSQCMPTWLYYFFQTDGYWGYVTGSQIQATIQNVSAEKYANLFLPLPPLPEQRAIASFLDRETSKIDALVAEQRKLIELLKEKRQAVISHAVTKGLNPDAPMKDSGIEWLGRVPEHWEVVRVKYLVLSDNGIQMGPFGGMLLQLDASDTGYKVYGQENTISGDFRRGHRWITELRYQELTRYSLNDGDLVLTRKGSLGNARLVDSLPQPGIIDSDTIRIRVDDNIISSRFLAKLLHEAPYVAEQITRQSRGAILPGVNTNTIAHLFVALPNRSEQNRILDALAQEASTFSSIGTSVSRAIDLLQERRTALISAAVTGKIDVRELRQVAHAKTKHSRAQFI